MKRKKINSKSKNTWNSLCNLRIDNRYEIIIAVLLVIYSVSLFNAGFHNIDICHNEAIISETFNLNLGEMKIDGTFWSLSECYVKGLSQIQKGMMLGILFSLLLGFVINDNKNKK